MINCNLYKLHFLIAASVEYEIKSTRQLTGKFQVYTAECFRNLLYKKIFIVFQQIGTVIPYNCITNPLSIYDVSKNYVQFNIGYRYLPNWYTIVGGNRSNPFDKSFPSFRYAPNLPTFPQFKTMLILDSK